MVKAPEELIEIELTYPQPDRQWVETLRVAVGTTVGQAIEFSRVLRGHPEISVGSLAVGIFGRRVELAQVLHKFDRIEIYRPLVADPKRVRRSRAQRQAKSAR
jgi:putative ubiquitin-RnfH superfamily antitoxin RatB of RatAB toxin-antitoxin module